MIIRFIYEPDYLRLIPAILIDVRASIPSIANQVGTVIKAYTDAAVAAITQKTIVYRLENAILGVMVGYMTVEVGKIGQTAVLSGVTLRPAYQSSAADITQQISNFMAGSGWQPDFLI